MTDVKPPEETTATLEDYREAHDDFRGEIDGKRCVCKWTTKGTALIPIEEDQ